MRWSNFHAVFRQGILSRRTTQFSRMPKMNAKLRPVVPNPRYLSASIAVVLGTTCLPFGATPSAAAPGNDLVERVITSPLRDIELPADLFGPGWRRLGTVRIDDFNKLDELGEAEREQAKLLKPQLVPQGIRGAADYSFGRTEPPLDSVTVKVYLFKDAETCRSLWNKKYRYDGWEKSYRTAESKYGTAVDSLQVNKRAVLFGNVWITAEQLRPGELHYKAAEYVIEKLTK
jgi:hypothetical protein